METVCKSEKALTWVRNASPYFIKNNMTVDEAKRIWRQLKDQFANVAAKSGISRRGMKNLGLLRKMQWIKAKAESEEEKL